MKVDSITSPLVGEVDPKGRVRGKNVDFKRNFAQRERALKIVASSQQETVR